MRSSAEQVSRGTSAGKANGVAAEGRNAGSPAGFVARLVVEIDGKKTVIVTDTSWQTTRKLSKGWETAAFKTEGWAKSVVTGRMGGRPWGDVFAGKAKGGDDTGAVSLKAASGKIEVAKDFKVELLYTVPKGLQGSWVSLCVDPKGRLIASDQGGKGLYRIDVSGAEVKVEKLDIAITSAQGLLFAFGWVVLGTYQAPWGTFGVMTAVLSMMTVYCTAMIYATLRPIHAWSNRATVPNYLALALWTGMVWLNFLVHSFGGADPIIAMVLVVAGFVSFYMKRRNWRHIDSTAHLSDTATATGLGDLGKVRQILQGQWRGGVIKPGIGHRLFAKTDKYEGR